MRSCFIALGIATVNAVVCCLPAAAAPATEWTIMVYMNGKNDLESSALADLNEMEAALPASGVNVVVELGRMAGYSSADGDWQGVRRYQVARDNDPEKINSKLLADLGPADMGKGETLADFAAWARAAYPAKKYLLIVWNHGSGWLKGAEKGISYDYETGHHIDTPALAKALKDSGRVDVLAFDACLMQMAEVAYELKDSAEYIAGSEEIEALTGYPYDALLGALGKDIAMDPRTLARTVVESYGAFYAARGEAATHSFIRTAALPGLRDRADAFAEAVMAHAEKPVVKAALQDAICYAVLQNTDLYDLVRRITEGTASPEVARAGRELMGYITNDLVGANRTSSKTASAEEGATDYSLSRGIAVYAPGVAIDKGYAELSWARDSRWDEFITWYLPFMR